MSNLRPVMQSAERALALEVNQRATIGHLRATARDIASRLYGVTIETGEVVALQDRFEAALREFCKAMMSPVAATAYTAPDATRAKITAMAVAEAASGEESNG